jgi:hypothetical protein
MPDRDLNRRTPFGIDEKAVELLHAILSRAAKDFEDIIRIKYSDKEDLTQHQKGQLASHIQDCTDIEYVISCSDRTSNHKLTFDELIDLPNYDHARINQFSVSVGSYRTPRISLQLETDPSLFSNIKCKVSGDYGFINDYGSQIEGWLRSVQKRYWWAYKSGTFFAVVVSVVVIVIPIVYLGITGIHVTNDGERSKLIAILTSVGIMAGLVFTPLSVFIGRIWFPIGEFAIGRGAGCQRRREHIVYSLCGGAVLVGLVVSVFANLVTGAIFSLAPH